LRWINPSPLPGRDGLHLREFSEEEQVTLLQAAIGCLREAGADRLTAFRAGNYGADFATLRALARCAVTYDSSYNPYYLNDACGLRTSELLQTPTQMEGVWEVPITSFEDWPGHQRHAQLVAISSREMERALESAWRAGYPTFVIVSHSFELIHRHWQTGSPPQPNPIVIRRFERLCRVLADHPDRYQTAGFGDLTEADLAVQTPFPPLKGSLLLTAGRYGEQLWKRLFAR
jgi:hypothetical protein